MLIHENTVQVSSMHQLFHSENHFALNNVTSSSKPQNCAGLLGRFFFMIYLSKGKEFLYVLLYYRLLQFYGDSCYKMDCS